MPLLVLTDCRTWHFLKVDMSVRPTTIEKYVCVTGIHSSDAETGGVASGLPLSSDKFLDAVPVCNEMLKFVADCKLYNIQPSAVSKVSLYNSVFLSYSQ